MLKDLGAEGLRLGLDAMGEALALETGSVPAAANDAPAATSPSEVSSGPVEGPDNVLPLRAARSGERPGVSIVIVTYNSAESISNCLTSLKMYCSPQDQVIVVDNLSGDATRTMLRKRRDTDLPDLHLIFADHHLGGEEE